MSLAQSRARGRAGAPGARRKGKRPGVLGRAARGAAGLLGRGRGGRGGPRRRRGITGTELRGFNRVATLLSKFGMVPRKLRGARMVRKRR